ncbi:hypothetical protein ES288_A10G266200v1 [Gossypium darwinii]|uniref:Uncharacterized protein n=1 Tax=Gossypium darwinii TaxID=34276 RepID=A0A5D2F4C5_GOSDA|nr:hypothetical protein ES288_A10G266200v1 [Gossypium darwinii]
MTTVKSVTGFVFFVDVNLFKANKERAAGIAKSNNDIVRHVNNGSSTSTIDGLANEDANLMIKLKFLTYKLRTFLIRNGLSILFKDGPAAYRAYYLRDVFSSIQPETIMQKSCRVFSSGDGMILIDFLNDIYFAEAFYHFSVIVLF